MMAAEGARAPWPSRSNAIPSVESISKIIHPPSSKARYATPDGAVIRKALLLSLLLPR